MRNYILKRGDSNYIPLAFYNPATQALQDTITWAAGDVKIIKDGTDIGDATNLPTLVFGRKTWQLELDATETTAKMICIEFTNIAIVDDVVMIETYGGSGSQIENIPATLAVGSIEAGTLTSTVIADNAITAAKISDNAITAAKIADNAVTAAKIADGTITAAKIATDAITSAKVADGTITAAKIATDAITSDKVATGAIKDGAIASAERDNIAKSIFNLDLSSFVGEAARSLKNAVRFIRNKWSISGTTLTVTKEDDVTTAWTATITPSAGSAPTVGVDPS